MDDYLNNDMVEAINSCNLTPKNNDVIRQILMRERSEKNILGANDLETIDQYDRLIGNAIRKGDE